MVPKAVLIGLPGSGKSTIGRRLAKTLDLRLLDTDAAIEKTTGRTIEEIFATGGEPEFRRIEAEVVREALATHDGVLSLGGGAVTTAAVREALRGHTVIYLEISAAEGVRRTGGATVRPLLAGPDRAEKFKTLMAERIPLYREVATLRVNTNRRNPGAVVRQIVARLDSPEGARPERRRRRPSWRRAPLSLATPPSADTPPSPAVMAARKATRSSGSQRGAARKDRAKKDDHAHEGSAGKDIT
ncbi:MAG: shikimate kinase [Mycolicibacterium sp.]|uniref:shikimate kinase n=1 Tax=Mycolicibacterium sp. TaxID=2320850 RepID=UPI003D0FC35C